MNVAQLSLGFIFWNQSITLAFHDQNISTLHSVPAPHDQIIDSQHAGNYCGKDEEGDSDAKMTICPIVGNNVFNAK